MPDSGVCSQACWLGDIRTIASELPKYRLGEILVSEYCDDETGETFSYRVQVVGVTTSDPNWLRQSGWWYFCKFLSSPSCEWMVLRQVVEPFPESDLQRAE